MYNAWHMEESRTMNSFCCYGLSISQKEIPFIHTYSLATVEKLQFYPKTWKPFHSSTEKWSAENLLAWPWGLIQLPGKIYYFPKLPTTISFFWVAPSTLTSRKPGQGHEPDLLGFSPGFTLQLHHFKQVICPWSLSFFIRKMCIIVYALQGSLGGSVV